MTETETAYVDFSGKSYATFEEWAKDNYSHLYTGNFIYSEQCAAGVWTNGRWPSKLQCKRKPGKGPFGRFCGQHAPIVDGSAERAKREAEEAAYRERAALRSSAQAVSDRLNALVRVFVQWDPEGAKYLSMPIRSADRLATTLAAVKAGLEQMPSLGPDDLQALRLELLEHFEKLS